MSCELVSIAIAKKGWTVMGDQFSAAGYGVTSVGWGERPAIVAVDFQLAFCDPAFATGRSDHIASAVANAEGC